MGKGSRHNSFRPEIKRYTYAPLETGEDSIRLLRFKPSNDITAPLQCSLFHTPVSTAPAYIALSYAWGDPTSTQPILVGDEVVFVTPNLRQALQHLRWHSGISRSELVMWVDAICINQENVPERNIQTQNMRAIYQNAQSVAVWLGLENNRSKDAMQLARDLNACSSSEEVGMLVADPERYEHIQALVALFRKQYWWRIWVIQEVSCGKSATVYCSNEAIPWKDLDNVCDILKEHEKFLTSLFYKNNSIVRTLISGGPRGLQLSRYSPNAEAPPLLELLISHKSKKSSDPKDKVYALVGISSSRYSFGDIDYSRSMRSIYSHTARHIISTSQKLDVICVKQHDINQFDLPSWAPDWTRLPSHSGASVIGLHHRQPEFTAAGDSLAEVEFLSDGYVIRATGIVVDTIKTVGRYLKKKGSPSAPLPPLHVFHDWWNLFVKIHSSSPAAQTLFGRVISCGSWMLEDEETYAAKLDAIFALSDGLLSESDSPRFDLSSRASTFSLSRSITLSDSVKSFSDAENGYGSGDYEEKTQLSTILSASLTMNRRRLFFSQGHIVGLAPWNALESDLICVLLGCRFPVILRRIEDHYLLIGEAYVDGFMNGEGMDGLREGRYAKDSFEIH